VSPTATATAPTAPPEPALLDPVRTRDSTAARLAAFVALAAFGCAHWAHLVVDPPAARAAGWVAIGAAVAILLTLIPRFALSRGPRMVMAAVVVLAGIALGLVCAGLSARLLWPGNLGELLDGLDRGFAGMSSADFPYDGPDPWVRLTLLLGAPALVGAAAGLAFWPSRARASARRAAALVLLLVLYGVAVTEHDPGQPLLRGLALLALIAAWLWLPRLTVRQLVPAAGAVAAVGLFALPLAAKLDADQPWWDYRSWDLFGGGKRVSFDWDHSYGPLDWPRNGTTLLYAKSNQPHYWKAETLDRFDGFRWLHSRENEGTRPSAELPSNFTQPRPHWDYYEYNRRWDQRARFTVRALRSDLVVGFGTTYAVRGTPSIGSADGTTVNVDEPLKRGDTYTVRAYAPDPTARQMRGAPVEYQASLAQYTAVFLPKRGEGALDGQNSDAVRSAEPPPQAVYAPLRGEPTTGSRNAQTRFLRSPYARMYRLAQQVTAGASTEYDAVKRIQNHLLGHYRYNEHVPSRDYPLEAFLFRDREGYCQQFSGAMGLMLRMMGIPSRVVSGFAPGSYNRSTGEYRVRDLDAHSWVEVYFPGIGWVTFDPTPPATPADQPTVGSDATLSAGTLEGGGGRPRPDASNSGGGGGGATGDDGTTLAWWMAPLGLALVAALGAGALTLRRTVRRGRGPHTADALVRELEAALPRLGLQLSRSTTLLALERRLRRLAGPRAAAYVARIRSHRYSAGDGELPGADERRALRRELVRGAGLRARVLGVLAIPPGGPRTR
jgi:transglutaminase-like putative cysteine protease